MWSTSRVVITLIYLSMLYCSTFSSLKKEFAYPPLINARNATTRIKVISWKKISFLLRLTLHILWLFAGVHKPLFMCLEICVTNSRLCGAIMTKITIVWLGSIRCCWCSWWLKWEKFVEFLLFQSHYYILLNSKSQLLHVAMYIV